MFQESHVLRSRIALSWADPSLNRSVRIQAFGINIDMCIDMCRDMSTDTCIGVCAVMCTDMCTCV